MLLYRQMHTVENALLLFFGGKVYREFGVEGNLVLVWNQVSLELLQLVVLLGGEGKSVKWYLHVIDLYCIQHSISETIGSLALFSTLDSLM